MNYCDYFKGKKITVMGLGLLGRGIGDVRTLAKCGAELIVTDVKTKEQLASSLEELSEFSNITYVLGEHRLEDFRGRDMILKAAGVSNDSPYIAEARACGIPIEMSAALFARLSGIPVIGVTGTRGKSTTTHFIHHVLSHATGDGVLLGGNVRGVSNLALLDEVKEDSVAVLELDSWQLQGFGESKISPKVAVFTNFLDDHLNYYKNDREQYFSDKAQIFLHQGSGDTFVTTPEVFGRAEVYAKAHGATFPQEVVLVDESLVPDEWALPLPGVHNRRNIALARAALHAMGLEDEVIRAGIETFPGLPGRLEFLGEHNGVKIYNDNNATTPDATIAALEAVAPEGRRVVLIAGGSEKNLDLDRLVKVIGATCKDVLLIDGTGTGRLHAVLKEKGGVGIRGPYTALSDAVTEAFEIVQDGDVLLFSPAFASFGMFQNEYQRNDQFVALIREHQE
ncbi:UDP-N-acetylmuramoyl-L-alanine--D-glutamate ligase [Candidatus Kaiserbacteria bacterium]|nr:UDP-N-acetylmuramoyl-L-alanine--D-glutamate ligase [Candidatus Kaiserbacteria bacterium]